MASLRFRLLAALDAHDLPVDVVQVDDGWSLGLGEWLAPAPGFGDVEEVVGRVRDSGRRAGLWLVPFLVGLGVDHLKLDFLYAGALSSGGRAGATPVEVYRSGLELIRDAAGDDVLLLGCGAPILPSVGLLDAMRVSPDTFHEGGEDGSRGLRGRMSLAARAWQHGHWWANDPDCLVARPSYALREEWARTIERFGGLRGCSDHVADLDGWGLETTRRLLATAPSGQPFDSDVVVEGLDVAEADGTLVSGSAALG